MKFFSGDIPEVWVVSTPGKDVNEGVECLKMSEIPKKFGRLNIKQTEKGDTILEQAKFE